MQMTAQPGLSVTQESVDGSTERDCPHRWHSTRVKALTLTNVPPTTIGSHPKVPERVVIGRARFPHLRIETTDVSANISIVLSKRFFYCGESQKKSQHVRKHLK